MNTRSIRFRLTVWYASLLAGALMLFSSTVYLGLGRYLEWTLRESLTKQAHQIGETFLIDINTSGEEYVIEEINEHYAPELNGRFVRVTRADGSVLYSSGVAKDGSFDPTGLPLLNQPVIEAYTREEHLAKGGELFIYALPFAAHDRSRFLIETGAPYEQVENVLHGLLFTLGLGLPVVVALAIGGGYVLMRRALKPVDEITERAERITSRNLSERLPITQTGDELERLSVSLNHMIARLEEAFQHISRFTADASHELRTPLTVLRGELEAFAKRPRLNSEERETIGSMLEETERLSKIVEKLLEISRLDAGEVKMANEKFNFTELVISTVEQLRVLAEDKSIAIQFDTTLQVNIEGDRSRLKQVIVNLLDNAIKYTPEGGSVNVRISLVNRHALLEVTDNGAGIPTEALPHIFERFFRVDKARSREMGGAGLGLSIAKSICTAHGGQINVESVEGKGSRFQIMLPLADKQQDGLVTVQAVEQKKRCNNGGTYE
ncbi:MAG: ATP-binding protein [Acidobacteriota bacterium]